MYCVLHVSVQINLLKNPIKTAVMAENAFSAFLEFRLSKNPAHSTGGVCVYGNREAIMVNGKLF